MVACPICPLRAFVSSLSFSAAPCIASGATRPKPSEWYHLVATRDAASGEQRIYVDGVLSGKAVCVGGFKTTGSVVVGRGRERVWAPETFFDEATQTFMVYWSSPLDVDPARADPHSLYAIRTRDFRTFTTPRFVSCSSAMPRVDEVRSAVRDGRSAEVSRGLAALRHSAQAPHQRLDLPGQHVETPDLRVGLPAQMAQRVTDVARLGVDGGARDPRVHHAGEARRGRAPDRASGAQLPANGGGDPRGQCHRKASCRFTSLGLGLRLGLQHVGRRFDTTLGQPLNVFGTDPMASPLPTGTCAKAVRIAFSTLLLEAPVEVETR
jgi:hypothetical protein